MLMCWRDSRLHSYIVVCWNNCWLISLQKQLPDDQIPTSWFELNLSDAAPFCVECREDNYNRTFPSTSQCPTPPNPEAYLEEVLSSTLFHFWLLSKQKLMDILEVEINGSSGEKNIGRSSRPGLCYLFTLIMMGVRPVGIYHKFAQQENKYYEARVSYRYYWRGEWQCDNQHHGV